MGVDEAGGGGLVGVGVGGALVGVGVAGGGTTVVGVAVGTAVGIAVGGGGGGPAGVAVVVGEGLGGTGVLVAVGIAVGVAVGAGGWVGVLVAVGGTAVGVVVGGGGAPLSSTFPKLVPQYQPYSEPLICSRAIPMTRYEGCNMFALWPGELCQASSASWAESQTVPAARFSPAPDGYPQSCARSEGERPSESVWEK